MTNLIEVFKTILEDKEESREHKKNSFWASECELPMFDLYHRFKGTTPTNPPDLNSLMVMNTGKLMELSMVTILQEKGLAKKNEDDKQDRVEMELEEYGIRVTGYVDAILNGDIPLEIKTFYGDYQEKDLASGKPRTSYCKQLAIYMYYMKASAGVLLYINRGNGHIFQFDLLRSGTKFSYVVRRDENGRVVETEELFDLADTFQRWSDIYKNYILKDIEPKSEYRYKIPLSEIDWNKVSNADISKARTNKKVIGDGWQVAYSSYKDLILKQEGSELGYSDEELAIIKAETAGYSSIKDKKK